MRKSILLALAAWSAAAGAQAQAPAGAAATAQAAPAPDPFQQAMAARAVADFARRQKDPQAMLTAARMLQEIPFRDGADNQPNPAFSPAGLFQEAKDLAKGDQALLVQIRIAESSGRRGVLSSAFGKGLLRLVREVAARTSYSFDVNALGGQILRIGAIGDIGTAMVMRMVDAAGKLACVDESQSYAPVCSLTPRASGRYHVEIANRSTKPSNTVILSN